MQQYTHDSTAREDSAPWPVGLALSVNPRLSQKPRWGTREATHWLKCLLYKCEDLNSGPQNHINARGVMACLCSQHSGDRDKGFPEQAGFLDCVEELLV